MARLVRFDLSEEELVLVDLPSFDGHRRPLYCRLMDADGRPCVVTSLRHDPNELSHGSRSGKGKNSSFKSPRSRIIQPVSRYRSLKPSWL